MSKTNDAHAVTNGDITQKESMSISEAQSVNQIQAVLLRLRQEHDAITDQLESCIGEHGRLLHHIDRLDYSRARLGPLVVQTRALSHGKLSDAAATAVRISGAVERLDLEQDRVKATLEVVDQVAELKACILGVNGSMGAPQDWETAAEYLHRASKISEAVINSGFAEEIVPTAEVPDLPSVTLHNAAQSLCQLFLREFDNAVKESDGARITRFFKMFPLIGRSEEGLGAYGKYVCQGVAARARAGLQAKRYGTAPDGKFYVNALTKLFEHIAQVVDGHSTLVERHYGEGTVTRVIERLHAEGSVQGGIILDTWHDERHLDRKLTDVKSYAFSFLVQSFLPAQRGVAGTPRTQSPALGHSSTEAKVEKDEGVDMKEVDEILAEMVTMLSKWSLYVKFIAFRTRKSEVTEDETPPPLSSPSFVLRSSLPGKVSKMLTEPFNSLATFFLRRSVEKAFQLDESPTGLSLNINKPVETNNPFITSAVDDTMYMVNQVVQRTLATSQAGLAVDVISTVARVLGSDFIGMIQRKMRDESYPKAPIQGASPPEDKVLAFLVLLNNLDVSIGYIKRIVRTSVDETAVSGTDDPPSKALFNLFAMNRDAEKVQRVLLALEQSFSNKASELIGDGISVTFTHVLKPRMRPILADTFRETDYSISEDRPVGHATETDDEAEESRKNVVKIRFQSGWDGLMNPIKRILSAHNFERLLATSVNYLSKAIEKRIWNYYGRISEYGAVQLERDVADIANLAVRGGNFKLREAFNKSMQIAMFMNMDEEEWEALESSIEKGEQGSTWELNASERQRARGMVRQRP